MNAHGGQARLGEGNKTQAIYSLIMDHKYSDAIRILNSELSAHPRSRAALSLLGHCYYYVQDFPAAVGVYEQLVRIVPESADYKMYLAQSYYKAGMYNEATKTALSVDSSDPAVKQRVRAHIASHQSLSAVLARFVSSSLFSLSCRLRAVSLCVCLRCFTCS